ncbi:MAG: cellulase family glycosylhydrolase [Clostridia bacterium]|nr:cellulase family glycosylhydrolase [Clostridia bacterium]
MNTISVAGKRFIDEHGRERIFNGINFVYKGVAVDEDGVLRYKTDLNEERLIALKKKGINVIRLGLTWAGIEPEMGKYNTEYLDGYKAILKLCEKHEVYVYIDWHQDLFSNFCSLAGDGAPKWACQYTKKSRAPKIIWAEGYFFYKDIQKSFDAFWTNEEVEGRGLRDRFCDMLTYTADYMKDCKSVMGYDVFNEPFPGSSGKKVGLNIVKNGAETILFNKRVDRKKIISNALKKDVMAMLSVADDKKVYGSVVGQAEKYIYEFDTKRYYPFLVAAAEAIRKVDKNGIIFIENCYFSNTGIPCNVPRVIYKNGEREENIIFSPHGYDLTVDTPLTNVASPHRVDYIFDEHKRTQERLSVPVLVGEWGGMVPGSEEYPALEHLIRKFDSNKWSHTYWHYFIDFEHSKIMDIISRPLPIAVAGEIKSYSYDRKENVFTLSYTGSSTIKAPTLIYLPKDPKKIYSTKSYVMKENGILQVYAGKGECIVKVEL